MIGYDVESCNALQRPFYRPIEAALRWCGLAQHEIEILECLGPDPVPAVSQFPQWPCLRVNTEKILDAIAHGEIQCGRDGKTVPDGEHVAVPRRTVRHADLRAWFLTHEPGQKPRFLFDEIERTTHAAINADSFRALQADRDALNTRLGKAAEAYRAQRAEITAQAEELAALKAVSSQSADLSPKSRNKAAQIIAGLVLAGWKKSAHGGRIDGLSEVINDLAGVGVTVDEGTLRTWMRDGAALIPAPAQT